MIWYISIDLRVKNSHILEIYSWLVFLIVVFYT